MDAARIAADFEVRAAAELRATSGRRLEGYASLFDVQTPIGDFVETVQRGSYRASLASSADILALVDHRPDRILARRANGSLRLSEDSRGLHFSLDVPGTTLGADTLAAVEAGLTGGASVGFRVKAEAWPTRGRRLIEAAELIEVSVIHAFPAVAGTVVTARSRSVLRLPSAAAVLRRKLEAML